VNEQKEENVWTRDNVKPLTHAPETSSTNRRHRTLQLNEDVATLWHRKLHKISDRTYATNSLQNCSDYHSVTILQWTNTTRINSETTKQQKQEPVPWREQWVEVVLDRRQEPAL